MMGYACEIDSKRNFSSPVYIDDSVNMKMVAKRLLWGKCVNAGQTCIAPDYILCNQEVQSKIVEAAKDVVSEWYGKNVLSSQDYPRIINNDHYKYVLKART